MQALAEQARVVRLPLNQVGALNKLIKTYSLLEQKHQRDPSCMELGESLGVSEEEIRRSLSISGRHLSLDAPFGQNEDNNLLETLEGSGEPPDTKLIFDSLQGEIARALATLTEREANVISLYFGLSGRASMTLEEIGEKFNITRERVRQIKEKATNRLRHNSRSSGLRPYLG